MVRIKELGEIGTAAVDDELAISDTDANQDKRVSVTNLLALTVPQITVSATAPVAPSLNDLWYDTS